jgi:hypothetical protein
MSEDNEAVDGHPWEQEGCGMVFKLIFSLLRVLNVNGRFR